MLRKMSSGITKSTIASQLKQVQDKIQNAASRRPGLLQYTHPRLVAVSKTKGTDLIIEAYDAGQRHFGENYVLELHEKANDIEIQDHCEDIKWHFIGHLQRNKVGKLLDVPNLYVVETVDSERLAKAVNDTWERLNKKSPLRVMVQVNTSGEDNKSGCAPQETTSIVKYIREKCPQITVMGLMTIGSFDHDPLTGPNPDFKTLYAVREEVSRTLNISIQDLELSMGMSADFEHAIEMGSTNVRVGSTIFGDRSAPPKVEKSPEESSSSSKNVDTVSGDASSLHKTEGSDPHTLKLQSLSLT
ncbi:pyridoxal phosphate homeostasis protein-like [Physella acuta]|uniref:pyridoxal phosphate homeostasis protein-like n=1 Tax=Physella acuta TaxID=109671 RepID=UPI0027DD3878|nr:pyridoxal phosphate homeostasis protein-like [Physella acuta]XP_059161502.1 pyridoxal phosphate homeostasis protein-like [Physella acuta]XP_059161503.1 pyridoxal phosphate homeostasis protein-like [Physella acuta]